MPRTIYALLVGIDDYPYPVRPLRGCVNDIRRVESLLNERVTGENDLFKSLLLLDEDATREGIINGFRTHLAKAGPDDVALFYYSGHGSQAPSPEEFWHLEPDRLDETLVCWDSRKPDANSWDLADKELAQLIAEVAEKNPHINIILDCCHSGSGTRGDVNEDDGVLSRRVPTDERIRPIGSFIVTADDASARENEADSRSADKAGGWLALPQGRHVVLSACQAEEEAKELQLGGEQRGAFSYFLLDTLQSTNKPISYRDIFKRVSALVRSRVSLQIPQLEATEISDLDQPFLGGAIRERGSYFTASHDKERGWVIDGGAVHGIPKPQATETTLLALFPFDTDIDALTGLHDAIGTATVTNVFPGECALEATLNDGNPLDVNSTYKAVITALPLAPLNVSFSGNEQAIELLRTEMATYNGEGSPSLLVSEGSAEEAELKVVADDEQYRIRRNGDAYPLVVETPGLTADSARLVMQRLEHMARWFQISSLTNSASQLNPSDIDITLYRGKDGTAPADEIDTSKDLRLIYEFDGETWRQPAFRIKLTNNGNRRLYCMLLDLTETYGVLAFLPGGGLWLEPGQDTWVASGQPIYPEVPKELWSQGATEFRDSLKLIFTTDQSDATLLAQKELPVNITRGGIADAGSAPTNTLERLMKRVGTRGFSLVPAEEEAYSDWMTSELVVTTVRPQEAAVIAEPGSRSVIGAGVTVRGHSALKATARLTSLPEASRDAGNLTLPPTMRDNPDLFQPLVFSNSRSGAPGLSILELENIQGHTEVTPENPLIIDIETVVQDDEVVLPVGFDGEFYLPLGRATKAGDRLEVQLYRLPEPTSKGTRSLTGSIKILFQKLANKVVDWPYNYPQLAVAKIVPNNNRNAPFKVDYITETSQIQSVVAGADRIVLYIHGIIGDTSGMVLSSDTSKLQSPVAISGIGSNYDLVLAFDYENLDTPIPETAQQLKEKLAAVGLGPNHGKTFHIVAHSMGGLVSRWFIERLEGNQVAQHLVMLGTPNQGSPWSTVEDFATTALGLGLNGFATVSWTARAMSALVAGIEKIDVALDQMNPESDFLRDLNSSPDPGIPYTIIAGNTSLIANKLETEEAKSLFGRLWQKIKPKNWLHSLTAPVFFGQPNDVAVLVESIKGVPAHGAQPRVIEESACDHMSYFSTQAGLSLLAEHIDSSSTIV